MWKVPKHMCLELDKGVTGYSGNVFKNYVFISKEIGTLENDMIELEESLSEQSITGHSSAASATPSALRLVHTLCEPNAESGCAVRSICMPYIDGRK